MGNKTLAFLICIVPIAYIYKFPFLLNNFGNAIIILCCLPIILFQILKNRKLLLNKSSKIYIYFSFYVVFITIYNLKFYSDNMSIKSFVYFIIFTFIYLFFISNNSFHSNFISFYKKFSVFLSLFLITQFILYKLFSFELTGIIPFIPTYFDISNEGFVFGYNNIVKISSFFSEPSHFALYVLPALCLFLWNIDSNSRYRKFAVLIISSATLLSTSANGIILLSIIIFLYIWNKYFLDFKIKYIALGITILITLAIFLINSSIIKSSTYSLFVVKEGRSVSKADARVYRGFLFYKDMDINNQILGIGWRNAENFAKVEKNQLLYIRYYLEAFDYFNSIAALLIYSGMGGLFLFMSFIKSIWKTTFNFGGKVIIIIIIASMTSSSIIMTEIWPVYLIILYYISNLNPIITNHNNESIYYITHS